MHCLVVDPNLAFATLLSEELKRLGYGVTTCASGGEAIVAARTNSKKTVELALLDMALEAPDALTLAHQLRAVLPSVRLVLIPMMGDEPLLGEEGPAIQGVLPKPFFVPELGERIEAVLQAPMSVASGSLPLTAVPEDLEVSLPAGAEESPVDLDLDSIDWAGLLGDLGKDTAPLFDGVSDPPCVDAPVVEAAALSTAVAPEVTVGAPSPGPSPRGTPGISRRVLRAHQEQIMAVMRELVAEVGADAVLLASETGVLAWVGRLEEAEVIFISGAVLDSRRVSAEVARALGREQLRFEQSVAGGSYLLYALDVQDAVLAVTVSGSASLGLLRHHTRAVGERIAELCRGGS
jgi:CheY-like chemotaxis protein